MPAFKRSANVLFKQKVDLYAHKNSWNLKIVKNTCSSNGIKILNSITYPNFHYLVKQECLPTNGLLISIWTLKYNRRNNFITEKTSTHLSFRYFNGLVTEQMNPELLLMALDRFCTNSDDSTPDQTQLRLGHSGV